MQGLPGSPIVTARVPAFFWELFPFFFFFLKLLNCPPSSLPALISESDQMAHSQVFSSLIRNSPT